LSKRKTFEEDMQKLEALVEKLEQSELGLEDSIKAYEEGMKLAAELMKMLENAQERVRKLTKTEQGVFELEAFEAEDEEE
jgi:exodeoxyribonuclease VII small subunit